LHLADRCGKGELSVTGGHHTHTQPHTAARSQRAHLSHTHTHTHTHSRTQRAGPGESLPLSAPPPSLLPPLPLPPLAHLLRTIYRVFWTERHICGYLYRYPSSANKKGAKAALGTKVIRRPGIEPGFERVCMPLIRCALRLADLVLATPNSTFKLSTSCYRFR
jgi:hypothetical protein